jgi:hypothetical protein
MIRLFTVFCKLKFNNLSAEELFFESMKEFSSDKLPFIKLACPFCGAKHPTWSYHDSYDRYLISYENGTTKTYIIVITRIICSSCKHTHAILPEVIIPHSSHSLSFVLMVLKDYFLSKMTVKSICEKYQISISMLYAWKKLFYIHKKLWLGVLENILEKAISFLSSIPTIQTSEDLSHFFLQNGYSFLQGISKTAHFSSA